ncbi:Hypothetical protein D9617_2g054540 [Elsinoe fawcettii]|nr:Hypothetical protein D9617_2g054540 [Elsinoe fawcettii]
MFSLPFSRATPRLHRQSTSLSGSTTSPSDDVKKGSWMLVQDAPTPSQDDLDQELRDLNDCLVLLTGVFPDIQAEVFREMLLNVSKESRVEVVTEYLLKDKSKWVRGRYKTAGANKDKRGQDVSRDKPQQQQQRPDVVAHQETFRSAAYRQAVKLALYSEFKGLSHASIKAVLAEHNSSYAESRPVLQQLSSKSWRYYLTNLWSKKVDATSSFNHPLINWQSPYGEDGPRIPYLRQTNSNELNAELYQTFIAPVMHRVEHQRLERDALLAAQLNEAEAAEYDALFECQCCYSSAVFEETAACSSGDHMVEDEEIIVKKAAEQAEKDWRAKQGQPVGADKLGLVKEQVLRGTGDDGGWWSFEDVLDGFVDLVLA